MSGRAGKVGEGRAGGGEGGLHTQTHTNFAWFVSVCVCLCVRVSVREGGERLGTASLYLSLPFSVFLSISLSFSHSKVCIVSTPLPLTHHQSTSDLRPARTLRTRCSLRPCEDILYKRSSCRAASHAAKCPKTTHARAPRPGFVVVGPPL